MDNLKFILKELQKLRIELKLQYDDNMLLDCGTRIFNAQSFKDSEEMITEKQRWKLDSLGYQGTYDLTKEEASRAIESLLKAK